MRPITINRACCGSLFAVVIAGWFSPCDAAESKRPNILWIIAEDMGPDIGCYGTKEVQTPHLDRFAVRGMRFTNAFTTAPVCSASRSAFMTGMYQTSIGAHNHRSHRSDGYLLPAAVKLLTHRLQQAGYFTANIRHLTDNPQERFFRGTGKTDWNFNVAGQPFESDRWKDLKSHQPFYAQINFSETHRGAAWDNAHKQIDHPADPKEVVLPPYYPDHPLARADWAQYLNTVMALDRKVGFVLEKLKADHLAENTIVIFFGDHGRAMVRGKQWCYDSGLRVPLMVYWPKGLTTPENYVAESVNDRLVEAIDLTATTLDMAGVKKPAKMQGRILFGKNADPSRDAAFGARDRCDETVFRIRTVRDKRYRYIRNFMSERPFLQINRYKEATYPMIPLMRRLHAAGKLNPAAAFLMTDHRPAEELYDIKNDPYEIHNLAKSPAHVEVLTRMRNRLTSWIESSGDQGAVAESPEIVKFWDDRAKRRYDKRIKQLQAIP